MHQPLQHFALSIEFEKHVERIGARARRQGLFTLLDAGYVFVGKLFPDALVVLFAGWSFQICVDRGNCVRELLLVRRRKEGSDETESYQKRKKARPARHFYSPINRPDHTSLCRSVSSWC